MDLAEVIVANRWSDGLADVEEMVCTRDLLRREPEDLDYESQHRFLPLIEGIWLGLNEHPFLEYTSQRHNKLGCKVRY